MDKEEIKRLLYFLQDNMYIKLLCNELDSIIEEYLDDRIHSNKT